MHARGYFVTGTDTGVGKTLASAALLHALRAAGLRASGMKPVASGCRATAQGLRNDDAEMLLAASDPAPDYALCNPFALEEAVAPHVAAEAAGVEIALAPILAAYGMIARAADAVVVEGVGGWAVPFSATLVQADLARALALPVVLVVGLRLGCLNHAILSARAIEADGLTLAGWIASAVDPDMQRRDESVATLVSRLGAPLLGTLPHAPDEAADARARRLRVKDWLGG